MTTTTTSCGFSPTWWKRSGEQIQTVARDLGDVLEERGEDAEQYVLTSLINEIAERDEPMAVIVDDWHRVTAAAVIGSMDFLLEHGCDNLQVVVTSRTTVWPATQPHAGPR